MRKVTPPPRRDPTLCNLSYCREKGTHQIGVKVWPLGAPKVIIVPAMVIHLDLTVCDYHKDTVRIDQVLNQNMIRAFQNKLIQDTGRGGNFSSAELVFTEMPWQGDARVLAFKVGGPRNG